MMPIRAQLHRLVPTTERLWSEAQAHIDLTKGCLIIDDSTLDKFYSRKIELVTRHWSGKHKRVVSGINLVTMSLSHYSLQPDKRDGQREKSIETVWQSFPSHDEPPELSLEP